jgi:hypothetical protein
MFVLKIGGRKTMRGVTGLALIFAIVIGMLGVTQVIDLEADVTSLSGGFSDFFTKLPFFYLLMVVVAVVLTVVGLVGSFFRR